MSELSDAMTPEGLADFIAQHADWYCEDVPFGIFMDAWRDDIARAQKAETDCTDLVDVAYHKGYHEGYRAAIQSQEKP